MTDPDAPYSPDETDTIPDGEETPENGAVSEEDAPDDDYANPDDFDDFDDVDSTTIPDDDDYQAPAEDVEDGTDAEEDH